MLNNTEISMASMDQVVKDGRIATMIDIPINSKAMPGITISIGIKVIVVPNGITTAVQSIDHCHSFVFALFKAFFISFADTYTFRAIDSTALP